MVLRRLQVGDEVLVIRGNYKGKRGKITRVLVERNAVVVEGVNVVKRHVRPAPQRPGGIIEVESPLDASKVMLVDAEGRRTRVRCQEQEGKKVRVAVKSGATLATRRVEP
jgi:large subunit ribosomal protein L24